MANSYISLYVHIVFSTKERQAMITPDLQNRLWAYIGGIARENHMKALSIGGMQDHVHVLLSLPSTLPVAKAMQLIKGGSSKWVHDTFDGLRKFAWQEGYGAFSVNVSLLEDTIRYIERFNRPDGTVVLSFLPSDESLGYCHASPSGASD